VSTVSVGMGPPGSLAKKSVAVQDEVYDVNCVEIGSYGVLFFDENPDIIEVERIGPILECNRDLFPDRANIGFAHVVDAANIRLRVWERGSGETLACGTGACAAVAAAVENGFCPKDAPIRVQLPGGDLTVRRTDDMVYLSGDCVTVFEGTLVI